VKVLTWWSDPTEWAVIPVLEVPSAWRQQAPSKLQCLSTKPNQGHTPEERTLYTIPANFWSYCNCYVKSSCC